MVVAVALAGAAAMEPAATTAAVTRILIAKPSYHGTNVSTPLRKKTESSYIGLLMYPPTLGGMLDGLKRWRVRMLFFVPLHGAKGSEWIPKITPL